MIIIEFLRTLVIKTTSIKQLLITTLLSKTYIPSPSKRKTQKWQIICFNSQFCANMKTNIYKIFMRLLNQHFSRHHKYYKLFNRKNIKLIYSFMPNMNNVIRKHNSKIVKNQTPCTIKICNCCQKTDCPWMVTVFLNADDDHRPNPSGHPHLPTDRCNPFSLHIGFYVSVVGDVTDSTFVV